MRVVLVLALFLGGCGFTPQGDLFRDAVSQKGAQAMDEGLNNAMFFICNAASHGSVERRFGQTQEIAAAYNKLCGKTADSTLSP